MWIVCPRGLLFCYLAGMEAAFRNISKILRLCFPTVVTRWILFPVRALSCLMGWCLWRRALCLPFCCVVSLLCLLVCTMQLATSDSSQVWTKSGHTWGCLCRPRPHGCSTQGLSCNSQGPQCMSSDLAGQLAFAQAAVFLI